MLYKGFTGRECRRTISAYRPMVWIGLGCLCWPAASSWVLLRKPPDPNERRPEVAFGFPPLLIAYVVSIFVEGSILAVAPDYTSFRQLITTLDTARLGILFLVFRRFCAPPSHWGLLLGVLAFEIVLGITGFFAGFREPIILAVLATLEVFDRRNSRHWVFLIGGAVAAVGLGLVWMGIRGVYRTEYVEMDKFANSRSARVERVRDLTSDFLNAGDMLNTTDSLVDRMWTVYYPALAVERVPSILPHTNGEIFGAALLHIVTPRIFFPNKGELMSDSDMVRKYSNIQVAASTAPVSRSATRVGIDFGVLRCSRRCSRSAFIGFMYGLFRSRSGTAAVRLLCHRRVLALGLPVRTVVGQHAGHRGRLHGLSRRPGGAARPLPDGEGRRGRRRRRSAADVRSTPAAGSALARVRVLHVSAYFPPARPYGGPPASVLGLCRGLQRAGVEVEVVTTTANGSESLPSSSPGADLRGVPTPPRFALCSAPGSGP